MAIFMDYEGIKGNVTAAGYQGLINLDGFVFRSHRTVSMKTGELANREGSAPTLGVLETVKRLDGSIIGIIKEAVSNTAGKTVKIHCVRTGQRQFQAYMTLTFSQCIPTFYRLVGLAREGGIPAERLYLSYSAVEISYIDSGIDNKALNPQRYGYDVAAASSL